MNKTWAPCTKQKLDKASLSGFGCFISSAVSCIVTHNLQMGPIAHGRVGGQLSEAYVVRYASFVLVNEVLLKGCVRCAYLERLFITAFRRFTPVRRK